MYMYLLVEVYTGILRYRQVHTGMYMCVPCWEFLYWPVQSCTGTYWYVPVRTILPNPVQGYRIPDDWFKS